MRTRPGLPIIRDLVVNMTKFFKLRLDDLNDAYRLFRCRTIMNCAEVCPKGLQPACDREDQVDDGDAAAGSCGTSNASTRLSEVVEGCLPLN